MGGGCGWPISQMGRLRLQAVLVTAIVGTFQLVQLHPFFTQESTVRSWRAFTAKPRELRHTR